MVFLVSNLGNGGILLSWDKFVIRYVGVFYFFLFLTCMFDEVGGVGGAI